MQFHAEPGIILARRFGIAASLRLTQGCSWIWEIALGGVSAKVKPLNRSLSPAEKYVGTSGDEIKLTLTVLPRRAYWTLVLCVSGGIKAVCDHGDLRSPPSQGSLRYRDWSKLCRALILWAQPEGWVTQTVSSERCCREQNG